ncbi:Polyribonucleotide nucleotidyltransferase [Phytophthora rubi]|uniref:polyribonucleotide nucleotidyltransferase n=1 Tax=Phytophthora rubi TaxID=129364 RepID=A0A6A4G391_9STRA|nr:Polyribonucleotide nucleotidyltransferase [Phytophthora rubi]KAE9050502.1 Polyribonucleotide nucleotidyltransferase [Phytophthora rubi]KAE9355994.1 Polyribonucleotide nucleotidyltransferase [Phytophthora rubi]
MLSTAARRLPRAAVARRAAVSAAHFQHQRVQARTFFGLREFLFGPKKPSKEEEEAEAAVKAQAEQLKQQQTETEAKPKMEKEVVTGSLDATFYTVGKLAKLADGAVLASCGRTVLLTTVVSGDHNGNPSASSASAQRVFLPLTVDFRVKSYAVGLIPDNQKRREFTGSDEEVLQSRVVDRAVRPLFPRDYCEDTQVLATVQSYDPNNDPLVVAVNSASAVLSMSDIPWNGPVGCVRVVEVDGQLVVNPTAPQRDAATLDVLYAGTDERAVMVEASGDEVTEARLDEALDLAHASVLPVIEEQKKLAAEHGKRKRVYSPLYIAPEVWAKAEELGREATEALIARGNAGKLARQQGEREVYSKMLNGMRKQFANALSPVDDAAIQRAAHDTFQRVLRESILTITKETKAPKNKFVRLDGRPVRTVRPLEMEAGVLPMAHGSSLFARGETQTLCSVTLGPLERGMRLRGALHEAREQAEPNAPTPMKNAMLHYEFPPFCVNETGRVGGTNRRMIGHGALAEKAVLPILPSITEFPYTVRMTSEVVGSDGSSSMATVCGVSLALMDAGVPIRRAVAGIAIGLVTPGDPFAGKEKRIEEGNYQLVTDILGSEDHYGDMDFKVAGTTAGVTAMQLDVKLPGGVPLPVLKEGLREAKQARLHILRRMGNELAEPRENLKSGGSALPDVSVECVIPTNTIGALIGVGGSNIRELESRFNVSVNIVDRREGIVRVVGTGEDAEKAHEWLQTELITLANAGPRGNNNSNSSSNENGSGNGNGNVNSRDNDHQDSNKSRSYFFRKGERYTMRVKQVMDFGAILESSAGQRGFVHISELSRDKISNIQDAVSEGQEMEFECLQDGASGKMSRRVVLVAEDSDETSTTSTSSESSESTTPRSGHHHARRASSSPAGAAKRRPRRPRTQSK